MIETEQKTAREPKQIVSDIERLDEKIKRLTLQKESLMEEYDVATQDRIPRVI